MRISNPTQSWLPTQSLKRIRAKMLIFFNIGLCVFGVVFFFAYWLFHCHESAVAILFLDIFLMVSLVILLTTGQLFWAAQVACTALFAVLAVLAFFNSGYPAPSFIWHAIIPAMAMIVCGARSGIAWFVLTVIQMILFYMAAIWGYPFEATLTKEQTHFIQMLSLLCMNILVFATAGIHEILNNEALEQIKKESVTDELTGLYNRRGFMHFASHHFKRSLRCEQDVTLVFLDVDKLKMTNDTYGHLAGDRLLVAVSDLLRKCFRGSDIIARLGGDEFCVILTTGSGDDTQVIQKRIEQFVQTYSEKADAAVRNLRLSVGFFRFKPGPHMSVEAVLEMADQKMYQNKSDKL